MKKCVFLLFLAIQVGCSDGSVIDTSDEVYELLDAGPVPTVVDSGIEATVSADVLVTGSGSPYRNNLESGSDILLLNENTVAVTELIDSGTMFTKTSANGRFTVPYDGTYGVIINAYVNDISLTSLSNYVYIVVKRYNRSNVLQEIYSGLSFQCLYTTIDRVSLIASIDFNEFDYLTVSISSDDSGGAFTYDVLQVNVRLTLSSAIPDVQ